MDEHEKAFEYFNETTPGTCAGVKHDDGKERFDLIPPDALRELAKIFTMGAAKYQDRNWEQGILFGRIVGAIHRHLNAFERGEAIDDESGLLHTAHAMWGCMVLTAYQLRGMGPTWNNLPVLTGETSTGPTDEQVEILRTATDKRFVRVEVAEPVTRMTATEVLKRKEPPEERDHEVKLSFRSPLGLEYSRSWVMRADDENSALRFVLQAQRRKLAGVNLSGRNLTDIDLTGANLTGADLDNTNLTNASLVGANLTGACMVNADMIGVTLKDAKLKNANLRGANLSDAVLSYANFTGARCRGVIFTGANVTGARFDQADLQEAVDAPCKKYVFDYKGDSE